MLINQRQILGLPTQSINTTTSVTEWGSIVEIGNTALTANIVITLPTCVGNVGKSILFKRIDNTAFTVTIQAFGGQTVEITTSDLNTQFGGIEITCVSATKSEQTSNNKILPTQINLLAQIATIATTTIYTVPQAGLYQIIVVGSVGTIGSRALTAQNIIHTETSVVRTHAIGVGINTSAFNNFNSLFLNIQCDAGTVIQYNNTMTGTTGDYNVRILVIKLN